MMDQEKEYDKEGRVIRENRSQSKRDRNQIKDFVEELLRLPPRQYALLPISQTLQDALILGQRLTNNALKRHMNFLTRLVIDEDADKIQAAHIKVNHPYLKSSDKSQRIIGLIHRLLNNDKEAFLEIMTDYQEIDLQYVRQTLREENKYQQTQAKLPEEAREKGVSKYYRRLQKYFASLPLAYHPDDK